MRGKLVCTCLLVWTAACSDGYPSKGSGLNLHFQMTQQEAVDALNIIGSRPHLKHDWRYQVANACTLEVSTHGRVFKQKSQTAGLLGSEISMLKSEEGKSYSVVLSSKNTDQPVQTTVLAGGTWSDASQIKWLLEYMPKFCESSIR